MNKKKLISNLAIIVVLTSFVAGAFIPVLAESPSFHSVYGFVFINDVLAEKDTEVKLTFIDNPEEIPDLTDSNAYYQIDFIDHDWEEGFFTVRYEGEWFIPVDNSSIEISSQEIGFEVDLHVSTLGIPPDKPINPQPENNSENVTLNPSLSVYVNDPDNDDMDVYFYDAKDDSLIGLDKSVPSGGTASVVWGGLSSNTTYFWYAVANDSVFETTSDIWNFKTKIVVNQPPNKPTNPYPENGAKNVEINPYLSVDVSDPDGDTLDVYFFDAADNYIGTVLNVPSGGSASYQWEGLSYNKTYSWYAIADDTIYETRSDTWSFKTKEFVNNPPEVSITNPQKGLYIFGRKILPRFIRPALIIGKITIEADATDEDSGIERVDFYINGKLKGNDNTTPYEFLWKWNRPRLFHIFIIKVVAIDEYGEEASDKMLVRKFL